MLYKRSGFWRQTLAPVTNLFARASRQTAPTPSPTSLPLPPRDLLEEVSVARRSFLGAQPTRLRNPDDLIGRKGLRVYREMAIDDAIKAAIALKKHAVLSTGWDIEPASSEPLDTEVADFITHCFVKMDGSLDDVLYQLLSSMVYGFSVTEWVCQQFADGDPFAGKLGLKSLKPRAPFPFTFVVDAHDNLMPDGVEQFGQRLPAQKFVIHSYGREFGDWYGLSDLRAAYQGWWMKENVSKWWALYLDRFGVPLAEGIVDRNAGLSDQAVGNMRMALDNLQAASSIVHPSDIQIAFPTLTGGKGPDQFQQAMQSADLRIARALLVPSLLGLSAQAATGSYSQSQTHFDVFLLIIQKLQRELADGVIGEQIIRRIVDLNYRVSAYPKFVFLPFSESTKMELLKAWNDAVTGGSVHARPEDEVHIRMVTAFPDVPVETLQAEQAAPTSPPDASGQPPSPDTSGTGLSSQEIDALIEQVMAGSAPPPASPPAPMKPMAQAASRSPWLPTQRLAREFSILASVVADGKLHGPH